MHVLCIYMFTEMGHRMTWHYLDQQDGRTGPRNKNRTDSLSLPASSNLRLRDLSIYFVSFFPFHLFKLGASGLSGWHGIGIGIGMGIYYGFRMDGTFLSISYLRLHFCSCFLHGGDGVKGILFSVCEIARVWYVCVHAYTHIYRDTTLQAGRGITRSSSAA